MKYLLRGYLRNCLHRIGLDLSRYIPLERALAAKAITTVFDIGANQGQFGSELRRDGYKGRIVSFEPMMKAHRTLVRKSRRDGLWEVHERCAIGAENGVVEINVARNSGSSSILPMLAEHLSAAPDSVYIGKETVAQLRFDEIFRAYIAPGERSFMKIDTQGYEKEVMVGAPEALATVTGLQLEVSFFDLYERQPSYKYFLNWAEANGFRLWSIHDGFSSMRDSKTLQADVCFFRA